MNFNYDTGLIDTLQTLDCSELPPNGGTAGVLTLTGTGALLLLQGSTSARPTGVAGMFRFNTDTNTLEYFDSSIWQTLTSSAGSVSSFQTTLVGLTPSTVTTGAVVLGGILGLASGGTNSDLSGSNGSIVWNNGTALINSTVGTLGQVLTSAGAGAPTWSTVSSTTVTNEIIQGNGSGAFTANGATFVGSGSFSGVTLQGTVTNATDAVTKAYVDSAVAGLSWKGEVSARTTTDLGTVSYNNGTAGVGATLTNAGTQAALVLDGYTVQTGNRVLVANETNSAYNGIYTVTNTGSASTNWILTRSTDNNTSAEMTGAAVFVVQGIQYANTSFVQTTVNPTIGTSNILWTQFAGPGTYTAGSGLSLVGTQFNVKTDGVTMFVNGSNNLAVLSSSTVDQILMSQGTGNAATWGTLQAGSNIYLTTSAGSITVAGPKLYAENASGQVAPVATGTNAIAHGSGAKAALYGAEAFANGTFASSGDAQKGIYILRNITTNATATTVYLDGSTTELVFPNNSVVTFEMLVAARRTDATGGGAGFIITGVIKKDTTAASNAFVGNPATTILGRTNNPWTVTVTANTTTGALHVTVTGETGKTIRWVATVETTEVTN